MLNEFMRALRPNGIIIILTAQKEVLEDIIGKDTKFSAEAKYDTLVSGKKASIYKIKVK